MSESTVVGAVAAASLSPNQALSQRIQAAMSAAVEAALAEGLTTEEKNSVALRERMMAARQRVLEEHAAEQRPAAEREPASD